MKARTADIAVVGAGIIGLFCAYFLARRGLKVVVLERKTPGAGSSTRNGGGVRSQWGTATNIQLSMLSQPYWAEFQERFGKDPLLRRIGYLFLAPDGQGLDELRRQVALQHEFGVVSEILTATDVATRWPSLAGVGLAGASFCATDGYLNQHRVMHAVAQAVEAAGVTIECGVEVTGLEVRAGQVTGVQTSVGPIKADLVVNCAGAWAPGIAEPLGVSLPIRSRRVQHMLASTATPLPADLPWLIDPVDQVHIRQDTTGRALVGGFIWKDETVDPLDFDHDADAGWRTTVLQRIADRFGIEIDRSKAIDSWAGLYPTTPDQHPIIDRTEGGMVVVGGFAGAGLMHSPAAGLLAAEVIVDGHITSPDPAPLSLARFSKPMESIEQTGF